MQKDPLPGLYGRERSACGVGVAVEKDVADLSAVIVGGYVGPSKFAKPSGIGVVSVISSFVHQS
jgi:hypothetical protein